MLSRAEIRQRAIRLFGEEPNKHFSNSRELRFGHKGSKKVVLTGEYAGVWKDFESGDTGSLVTRADLPPDFKPNPPKPERFEWGKSDSFDKLQNLLRRGLCEIDDPRAHVWANAAREGLPTPARAYLERRGLANVPRLHSIKGWIGRGIAYLGQARDGRVAAAQIIPLTQDGQKDDGRWPDHATKRTYSAGRNWHMVAAVRLPGSGEPILCEGVENGLSAWMATGRPVMCSLGTAGIAKLKTGVPELTIAADPDAPGSPAHKIVQNAVAMRRELGQKVKLVRPPEIKVDLNDMLRRDGIEAVRGLFR